VGKYQTILCEKKLKKRKEKKMNKVKEKEEISRIRGKLKAKFW
jgi:hypothetical protein